MPATPRRARNFGGSSQHQKLMMANLAASLIAAEGITTTEAKAKALRPIAEKLITKAKKAQDGAEASGAMRIHRIRQIQGYLGDKEMTHKLVNEVAPRYEDRNGGYLRILKLGPRQGDNAPMARIELV
jgi:large subunit ribosomal protein L17